MSGQMRLVIELNTTGRYTAVEALDSEEAIRRLYQTISGHIDEGDAWIEINQSGDLPTKIPVRNILRIYVDHNPATAQW